MTYRREEIKKRKTPSELRAAARLRKRRKFRRKDPKRSRAMKKAWRSNRRSMVKGIRTKKRLYHKYHESFENGGSVDLFLSNLEEKAGEIGWTPVYEEEIISFSNLTGEGFLTIDLTENELDINFYSVSEGKKQLVDASITGCENVFDTISTFLEKYSSYSGEERKPFFTSPTRKLESAVVRVAGMGRPDMFNEEDVKAKYSGVMALDPGEFADLSVSELVKHLIGVARKRGKSVVSRAVVNLIRWNKKQNPELSKKATSVMNALKVSKDWESIGPKHPKYAGLKKVESISKDEIAAVVRVAEEFGKGKTAFNLSHKADEWEELAEEVAALLSSGEKKKFLSKTVREIQQIRGELGEGESSINEEKDKSLQDLAKRVSNLPDDVRGDPKYVVADWNVVKPNIDFYLKKNLPNSDRIKAKLKKADSIENKSEYNTDYSNLLADALGIMRKGLKSLGYDAAY